MMRWIAAHSAVLAAVVVLIGAALYSVVAPPLLSPLDQWEDRRVVIEGVVVRDRDVREKTIRLTVRPDTLSGTPVFNTPLVLVSTDRFSGVAYGDRIQAVGIVRAPTSFETDTGRSFNYPQYLRAHGISHNLPFADVEVLGREQGVPIVAQLLSIKHAFLRGLERALPEPERSLAAGILIGEKQSLGNTLYDSFVASGIIHIVVLSGYNVALVITAVLFVALRMFPRLIGFGVAALAALGFLVMTGGAETTVRATIMALLMMVARVLNRPADALRLLAIAAATMALINPFIVLYDLSFQLSVLATLGLIVCSPPLIARLQFVPEKFGLRDIVATTLATQFTVLPLLILSIGAVSLVFIPANVLVLPLVPLAMLTSFIGALSALISPTLSFMAFPAYGILHVILTIGETIGSLPFASITIPASFAWGALAILFMFYGALALIMRRTVLK